MIGAYSWSSKFITSLNVLATLFDRAQNQAIRTRIIYALDPINNEIRYIGKRCDLKSAIKMASGQVSFKGQDAQRVVASRIELELEPAMTVLERCASANPWTRERN